MQHNIFQILQRRFLFGVVLGLWQSCLDSEDRDFFRLRDTLYLLGRKCPFILPFLLRGLLCKGRRTCQRPKKLFRGRRHTLQILPPDITFSDKNIHWDWAPKSGRAAS